MIILFLQLSFRKKKRKRKNNLSFSVFRTYSESRRTKILNFRNLSNELNPFKFGESWCIWGSIIYRWQQFWFIEKKSLDIGNITSIFITIWIISRMDFKFANNHIVLKVTTLEDHQELRYRQIILEVKKYRHLKPSEKLQFADDLISNSIKLKRTVKFLRR